MEKFLGEGLTGQTWIHCHVGLVSCGQRQDHVVQTWLPGASPHLFLSPSNLAVYRLAFSWLSLGFLYLSKHMAEEGYIE